MANPGPAQSVGEGYSGLHAGKAEAGWQLEDQGGWGWVWTPEGCPWALSHGWPAEACWDSS